MKIEELIRRLQEQMNARIVSYNDLTEQLNTCRSAESIDLVREAGLVEQRSSAQADIDALRVRIEGMEKEARDDAAIAKLQSQTMAPEARVQVGAEANPVYRKGDTEHSYFRDLFSSRHAGDQGASQRLANSQVRAASSTAGAGGEMAPPLWLIDEFVGLARAGRIIADQLPTEFLPGGVSSINLPKITAGASVAVTVTQNTTITESSVTTTSVSSGITEITGKQTVPLALLRQSGISLDSVIVGDLAAAYATMLDQQVISGSAASGQLRGLITAGTTVTYTSGAPAVVSTTAANSFYMKVLSAQASLAGTRFLPADKIFMHPRRWAWILGALDSSNRPLVVPNGPAFNQVAVAGEQVAEGPAGQLLGLPVFVDPNIPTNLGVATNQDVVFVVRSSDLKLYESAVETASFDATYADQNSILYRVLGFSAFIPNRHQASVQVISGTGLVAPAFA